MAFTKYRLSAANPAVTNRFVTSTNMANGNYTLANTTMPTTPGARRVTFTITGVTGNDTPGTVTLTGTDIRGQAQTETVTLVAGGSTTSTKAFVTVTQATQAGWAISGGNDTIVIGAEAGSTFLDGEGQLYAVVVNTTAAGTVTLADSGGSFAVLKASIPENTYYYEVAVSGLTVTLAAASDVTVICSAALPTTYSA